MKIPVPGFLDNQMTFSMYDFETSTGIIKICDLYINS